jgi:hypothetical protein
VIAVGGALWLGRGSLLNWSGPRSFGADGGRTYPTASHPAGAYATSSATADPAGPFAVALIHDEVRWRFFRAHEVKDSDLGLWLGRHRLDPFGLESIVDG